MKCSICGKNEAIYYQPFTKRYLCKECFLKDVQERVKKEVIDKNMFSESDRLFLALSGGKDSFVLLDTISKIHDNNKIIAFSIVEGIRGYNRQEYIERLKKHTKERGIELLVYSIKEFVGHDLEELVQLSKSKNENLSPCTYCGAIRRRMINVFAREIGATKTLTAHTLDDEVQTLMMNIMRGDPVRLLRQHPMAPRLSEKLVQRVKPLRKIYEREAALYAYLSGFAFQETECPYIIFQPTLRARIRYWLYMLEREEPGTLLRIVEFYDYSFKHIAIKLSSTEKLPLCKYCGEPTSIGRDTCKLCEMLKNLSISPQYNAVLRFTTRSE